MGESLPDAEMDKVMAEYGKVQDAIEAANGWDLDRTLETAMDALRCPPPRRERDEDLGRREAPGRALPRPPREARPPPPRRADEPPRRRVGRLARAPPRGVPPAPSWRSRTTATSSTTSRSGSSSSTAARGIPWKGNYTSWLEQKKNRLEQEEKAETAKQKTLERELEWVKMAPRARHAKGKARLQAYEQLLSESGPESRGETNEIYIPAGPRLGDVVVRAEGLKKAYGDNLLFDDLTFDLPKGGIVGVIGPNGAGKTTLFKMIMGLEKPDGGVLTVGETVVPSYVDQNRDRPDPTKSVWEEVSGGEERIVVGRREMSSRAWCSMFNFKGADQQKRIGDLSGGEMNRLHLARTVKKAGNLLLLDEPTNDLDVDTLRALEEALLSFAGCAVVISHDRWFLDRVATHMLAFEGDSKTFWYEGNYQEYEADRHKRLGAAADMPHRIKYRKLTTG